MLRAPPKTLRSSVDRFPLLAGLNLNLLRLAGLGDRHLDFQNTVIEPAAHMIQVQARRQRDSSVELAISELCERILVESFRRLALTLDNELVVLHSRVNVFFRDT